MMELGTREILLAVGLLLIVVIVLDGIRRMRQSSYGQIRMARRQRVFDDDDDHFDPYGGELPGKVRVREREEPVLEPAAASRSRSAGTASRAEPEHTFSAHPDIDTVDDPDERLVDEPRPHELQVHAPQAHEPQQEALNLGDEPPAVTAQPEPRRRPARRQPAAEPAPRRDEPEPEVVALHVMAAQGGLFMGDDLLNELMANDLRYGSMKIFHRHEGQGGMGPVLFSLANSVKPGTFDLHTMDDFSTPGVSLFMALDDLENPSAVLDEMLGTAHNIADGLGGELKDESRSALTRQTEDHLRQRVKEFERRRLYRATELQ